MLDEFNLQTIKLSAGARFANYIIDVIVYYIICFLLGIVLAASGSADILTDPNSAAAAELKMQLIGILLWMIYYSVLEGFFGITIGKLITGSIVVDNEGNKISFGKAVLRTLSRLVPFEPFSFLGSGRGWHDRWTDTYVVNKKKYLELLNNRDLDIDKIGTSETL